MARSKSVSFSPAVLLVRRACYSVAGIWLGPLVRQAVACVGALTFLVIRSFVLARLGVMPFGHDAWLARPPCHSVAAAGSLCFYVTRSTYVARSASLSFGLNL